MEEFNSFAVVLGTPSDQFVTQRPPYIVRGSAGDTLAMGPSSTAVAPSGGADARNHGSGSDAAPGPQGSRAS